MERGRPPVFAPNAEETLASKLGTVAFARNALAVIIILLLSGLISTVALIWPWSQWLLLGTSWVFIPLAGKFNFAGNLPRPAIAYIVWFLIIVVWGVIISPIFPVYSGFRGVAVAITVMFIVWQCGGDARSWRFMATLAPFGIILNLFVTYLMMTNGAIRGFFVTHNTANLIGASESRYGGLWLNPNGAAMQALLLLAISFWGPRWAAILGFVTGTAMVFLTASRTGNYILVLLICFYAYYFFRQSRALRIGAVVAAPIVAAFFLYGALPNLGSEEFTSTASRASSVAISRVFDPTESHTDQADTRVANFQKWQPVIGREPWYGYGFDIEGGSTNNNPDSAYPDHPNQGTHNQYLGILVDNGIFGFISFIAVLLLGVVSLFKARLSPWNKAALGSLWIILLVFQGFVHGEHLLAHGDVMLFLCFLGSGLPALQLTEEEQKPILAAAEQNVPKILGSVAKLEDSQAGFRRPGRAVENPTVTAEKRDTPAAPAPQVGFRKPGRPKA